MDNWNVYQINADIIQKVEQWKTQIQDLQDQVKKSQLLLDSSRVASYLTETNIGEKQNEPSRILWIIGVCLICGVLAWLLFKKYSKQPKK